MTKIKKAVILAGGYGTRISEESSTKPKPMIEIGGRPILWHIMKIYSHYGIEEFIICLGYKGYIIKEYFANYWLHTCDLTIDFQTNKSKLHEKFTEPWKVTLVDTGENTMTGGRLKRISSYIDQETFCVTYGDGVSNINLHNLFEFHQKSGRKATLTAVQPPGRFGAIVTKGGSVKSFQEKPIGDGSWINGGFFIFEPSVFDYIDKDSTVLEQEPLQKLSSENQLSAYKHDGFWHAMDTLRDKNHLEELWSSRTAPWKIWE